MAFLAQVSTQQLITKSISTLNLDAAGSGRFLNLSTQALFISSINGQPYGGGGGGGLAAIPSTLSTFAILASSVRASTFLLGGTSTLNALRFFGLQGAYINTALAEVSTGTGTQELLVFKGSSASDRIRVQTTGNFVVETGVSARLWPTAPSNVTPAFIINTSSNVGIQTANPGAALDVAGTGRFVTLSSQQVFTSSVSALAVNSVAMTTSNITISTLTTRDQYALNPSGTVYQKSTFLYYNSYIFAGTKQAFGQILTLGIGTGSGGNVTTYVSGLTTYTVHSFTTSSNFAVSGGNLYADVFVLGGGGGGGGQYGGGGGGGGFRYVPNVLLTSGNYTITVGQGGAGSSANSSNGQDSVLTNGSLTYTGFGGGGAGSYAGNNTGSNGGCGGGGSGFGSTGGADASNAGGTASQGYNGGQGVFGYGGAGGGGMGGVGTTSTGNPTNGGNGSTITITGTAVVYGGGGAGGSIYGGYGGAGGGGNASGPGKPGTSAGTDGLGGGGGGAPSGGNGARGGSGIVIIRYPPG